jgi:hypothetical protein
MINDDTVPRQFETLFETFFNKLAGVAGLILGLRSLNLGIHHLERKPNIRMVTV